MRWLYFGFEIVGDGNFEGYGKSALRGRDTIKCGAEEPHAQLRRVGHPAPHLFNENSR
jgi:hypothetical protein